MRLKIHITGLVQGVGFRPFIFRLANDRDLKGYILNDTSGVLIEVEGDRDRLDDFMAAIDREKPDLSRIYSLRHTYLEDSGYEEFEIRESQDDGEKRALVLPDISTCEDCLSDITSPKNRRFLYPFTNCTNCGPRFTIIQSLPYDRKNTSMNSFSMCPECEEEYHLSLDRRFHAQPNACPVCGPWISMYDSERNLICEKEDALEKVVNFIRKGSIVAVKGIGGYHLVCDATNEEAVSRLRERKQREEKPVAVMFPSLSAIQEETLISAPEERAVSSVEKPIVIVTKKQDSALAGSVSPGNTTVGVFLPYSPLHHLILRKLKKPVVATSANISDEPIVTDEKDAFSRLADVADYFLVHNRDIVRRCDDSVVRVMAERQVPVRRSRGFAPLPVIVPFTFRKPVLALGPYMNATVAVGIENKVFLSQHIGDLDTPRAGEFYEETVHDLLRLLDVQPEIVAADMHPGYYSTKFGEKNFGRMLVKIQHHFAHVVSCMIENDVPLDREVIAFAFDGTGYGPDRTVWGGEVMVASYREYKRVYHLKPYKLPGGDRAVMEPRRTAFSLLHEIMGEDVMKTDLLPLSREEKSIFRTMLSKDIHSPATTSMGRLFDGVASILGLRHKVSYHAQAAVELEQLSLRSEDTGSYPFSLDDGTIDHRPMIEMIVNDVEAGMEHAIIARKFHNTVVKIILFTAELLRKDTSIVHVALSGGVFQNAVLLEEAFHALQERGFIPLIHQMVPPNDGGISLGQAVASHFL